MKKLLIKWVVLVVSIVAAAHLTALLMPGSFSVSPGVNGFILLFLGAAVLAFLNATVGNILKLLTLPLNCLTLGLFSLLINAAIFLAAGSLGLGFRVDGFLAALVGSILVSIVNGLLGMFFLRDEDKEEH